MTASPPGPKRLSDLGFAPGEDAVVSGICVDSRQCKEGDLFAAMPGSNLHGAEFAQYALRMGAAAVLTDAEGLEVLQRTLDTPPKVPVLISKRPRRALAIAAARFFERQPAHIVAVTGTNGKTSVASFTQQIWELIGERAVNFGTIGVEGAYSAPLAHTTPEPVTLHALLRDLWAAEITHAAMEASSHGLDQARLDGVWLEAAAFTNFTQDHLDYHETFEAYFEAKAGLFDRVLPPEGTAVINIDDPKGPEMVRRAQARGQDVITLGAQADIVLTATRRDSTGQDIRFSYQGHAQTVRLGLIGAFQAMNVLTAAGLAIACGAPADRVFGVLGDLRGVRGRMQLAATRQNGAPVFVDYSHTPDSLETALKALRPHVMGRLIVVFGAGGDRDRGKRPLMGKAAADHADVVFVTDDNPRSENPDAIRAEILPGCPEATEIGDRAQAILMAVDALQPGDALLVAGKGHETGQIIGDAVLPFDDVEQASMAVHVLDGMGA